MSARPSSYPTSLSGGTVACSRQQIAGPTYEPIDGMARPTAPLIRGLLVLRKHGLLFCHTAEGDGIWSRA